MSEKLTEQKIDEMIQELLQEKFPHSVDDSNIDNLLPKKGQPKQKRIKKIASLEKQDDELGKNDIEAGLLGSDDQIEKDIAKLATDSKSDDLQQDITDVINSLGGELNTTTGRIRKITDDPEQIAGDIKMGGGVAPDSVSSLTGKTPRGKVPNIKAYQSTIEQLSIFRQITGPAKFVEMQRIAEAIAAQNFPTDTRQMFEFITKANVLNYFGNLGKNFSALEAGLEFEKFCAILMNGLQVGGSGGAADVFLALKNGNVVPTSQKLYANYEPKQSNSGKGKGLHPLLQEHDEVYYYVGIKTGKDGTAASYTTYDFYVIKITQDGNNFFGASLNSEGVYGVPQVLGPYKKTGDTYIFPNKEPYSDSLAKIPFMTKADESASAIATYMKNQMTEGNTDFNRLSDSIYKVFGSLRKMGNDTQIYNAKKGKGKNEEAKKYIKNVATNYIKLKEDYNTLFNIGQGPKKKTNYMKKTTESKIQSLNDLITETIRDIKRKRK